MLCYAMLYIYASTTHIPRYGPKTARFLCDLIDVDRHTKRINLIQKEQSNIKAKGKIDKERDVLSFESRPISQWQQSRFEIWNITT